jgi:hypothetical protein
MMHGVLRFSSVKKKHQVKPLKMDLLLAGNPHVRPVVQKSAVASGTSKGLSKHTKKQISEVAQRLASKRPAESEEPEDLDSQPGATDIWSACAYI